MKSHSTSQYRQTAYTVSHDWWTDSSTKTIWYFFKKISQYLTIVNKNCLAECIPEQHYHAQNSEYGNAEPEVTANTCILLQPLAVRYQHDGTRCPPSLEILVRAGSLRQQVHVVGVHLQHAGHDAGKDFTGSLQQFVVVGGVVHQSWSAQDQRFWREIAQPDWVWPATWRLAVGDHAAARHQACQRSLLNKVWSLNRYPRIS